MVARRTPAARPSGRLNTQPDPLIPQGMADPRGAGPLAGATGAGTPHVERGTILSCDARGQVYRVALNSGRTMQMGRIRSHPGDMTLLPPRTIVVVTWALGLPYIMGVLPPEVASVDSETPQSITDVTGHGGDDPVLQRNLGANSRAPDEPRDILPGDFVGTSPDGASVSALHGKVAQLRGGALAKVQAFGDSDLVQIVTGLYRMISWMGESRILNEDGKTSFVWRGGTDQITQTGADEENYTIRLDVGHTGDVVKLEVTNREGQALFRFHVSATGACEIFAAGGLNQHGGGGESDVNPVRFHGRRETEVEGASTERVSGDARVHHEANATHDVGNNATENVGGSHSTYVTQDRDVQVGGNASETVAGTRTVVSRGRMRFEVRDGQLYAVQALGGNIEFTPQGSIFKVITSQPDAVQLGPAGSHATKYEELSATMASFKAQLDILFGLVATHVHPTGAPSVGPSPTLAPLANPLTLDLSSSRCTTTKVG